MIEIDGSIGEAGGQVLRTSLTLSVLTQKPLRIINIRAERKSPGLRSQHLKSVSAAREISGGTVSEGKIGSGSISLIPGPIQAGKYFFDIGTAGSTSLLLQTIYLPLSLATGNSKVTICGGTHVEWSPCYHYLVWHWLPYLLQMGFKFEISLERAGYYPRGGGRISMNISPIQDLKPINIVKRGKVNQIRGISAVSNLPRKIAERQRNQVVRRLGNKYPLNDIRIADLPSDNKGTVLLLIIECEYSRACFFALGAPGKPAEAVADEVIDSTIEFLDSEGAIDPFLADQLLLPLAIMDLPSKLTTTKITNHIQTNAKIIKHFLPVEITIMGEIGRPGKIEIVPLGTGEH